jgi:hypothetical protein
MPGYFKLDALFRADSLGSSSLSSETVVGFPVHYALEPVSVESLKILFDDSAAHLRSILARCPSVVSRDIAGRR